MQQKSIIEEVKLNRQMVDIKCFWKVADTAPVCTNVLADFTMYWQWNVHDMAHETLLCVLNVCFDTQFLGIHW